MHVLRNKPILKDLSGDRYVCIGGQPKCFKIYVKQLLEVKQFVPKLDYNKKQEDPWKPFIATELKSARMQRWVVATPSFFSAPLL